MCRASQQPSPYPANLANDMLLLQVRSVGLGDVLQMRESCQWLPVINLVLEVTHMWLQVVRVAPGDITLIGSKQAPVPQWIHSSSTVPSDEVMSSMHFMLYSL